MNSDPVIQWLLEGDISIQYLTFRDLLDTEKRNFEIGLPAKVGEGHYSRNAFQTDTGAEVFTNTNGLLPTTLYSN